MDNPRLYRSNRDRIIAGVAGGLAEYFNLDIALVRLLWVLGFFLGGGGIIAYIAAWIIIPDEKDLTNAGYSSNKEVEGGVVIEETANDQEQTEKQNKTKERNQRIFGAILIGIGIFLLLNGSFRFLLSHNIWPLLLIGLGLLILFQKAKEE